MGKNTKPHVAYNSLVLLGILKTFESNICTTVRYTVAWLLFLFLYL